MIETHAFGNFIPSNAKYLILGSFTGREAVKGLPSTDEAYDWFYGTKRNQFWPILEKVYGIELRSRPAKQALLARLGCAIADIIHQCERRDGSNLDANLTNIIYNTQPITEILDTHPIEKIYFTSRYVEAKFKRNFRDVINRHLDIELITLPSPSPRYARMSKEQKATRYKEVLPKL
jgi:hypoxanthine-DNA glycosylase